MAGFTDVQIKSLFRELRHIEKAITCLATAATPATDYETLYLCDPAGNIVIVTFQNGLPTAYTNLNGTPYAGAPTTLSYCNKTLTSEAEEICVGGTTTLLQYVLQNNGQPTGTVYYTDISGAIVPAPAAGTFTFGSCPVSGSILVPIQKFQQLNGVGVYNRPATHVQSITVMVRRVGNPLTPPTITDAVGNIIDLFPGDSLSWSAMGSISSANDWLTGVFSINSNLGDIISILTVELI